MLRRIPRGPRETAFHVVCECLGCDEEEDNDDETDEEEKKEEKPQAMANLRTRKELKIALSEIPMPDGKSIVG